METRIAALEKALGDIAADVLALDKVVHAIIATHPNPKEVALLLERQLPDLLAELRDRTFLRGTNPERTRTMADDLQDLMSAWIHAARVNER